MRKRMKLLKKWKRKLLEWEIGRPVDACWSAFVVPIVVMIGLFMIQGIFPFGSRSFLRSDMKGQYAPFFTEFYRILHGDGSLLYTWKLGMGTNFFAIFVYYLSAPWNWLVFFCPQNLIIEFMTFLMIIKMGLCSLTMTWYLRNHCGTYDFEVALFGCAYGLSGYIVAYGWNIMWLDTLWLLPLILRGLERLSDGEGGLFYCLTLALSILCNYYISMLLCIFLVIYFVAYQFLSEKKTVKAYRNTVLVFAGYSILAAGLCGILLLPELQAIRIAGSGNNPFPEEWEQYFGIGELVIRHLPFSIPTGLAAWENHQPNLFCGSFVFILLPVYFASGKISVKEKLIYGAVLLLFWFSFSYNIPEYLWHGLHYPRGLQARQAFLYIFLVLFLCYRGYLVLEALEKRKLFMILLCACLMILILAKWNRRKEYGWFLFASGIALIVLFVRILLMEQRRIRWLFLFCVTELCCHMYVWGGYTIDRTNYLADNLEMEGIVHELRKEDVFFRCVTEQRKTDNDGALMGFPGVTIFSSTAYAGMSDLFLELEGMATPVAYGRCYNTPLENMLFSVRYWIGREGVPKDWEKIMEGGENPLFVYKNPYALPLGFWADPFFLHAWENADGTGIEKQNAFMEAMGAGMLIEESGTFFGNGEAVSLILEKEGFYQIEMQETVQELLIIKRDKERGLYNVAAGGVVDLGFCQAGERIVLTSKEKKEKIEGRIGFFSEKRLQSLYKRLSEFPLSLSVCTETHLSGTISAPESGVLMTTIPYDPGWHVKVDGMEQKKEKLMGAFLGVPIEAGSHRIEMEFWPEGLTAGAGISLISLLFLTALILKRHMKK